MEGDGLGNDQVGRVKHLGQLAMVFRHRHGNWADFGNFLKLVFSSDQQEGTRAALVPALVNCRHNPGGKNWAVLEEASVNPGAYPMFDHERYSRPCISVGVFDDKKNPGLVVADLCNKARRFLSSIGKGDLERGREQDFDVGLLLPSSPRISPGSSQATDSLGAIDPRNVVDGLRTPAGDEAFDGDEVFDDEDVLEELEQLLGGVEEGAAADVRGHLLPLGASGSQETRGVGGHLLSQVTISTVAGQDDSQDSAPQLGRRATTKMRAATLAYLWGFADDPQRLREEFRRLRHNPELQVLHLCGCGICYTSEETGNRVLGCVEWSHLRLGSEFENRQHKHWHNCMIYAQPDQYASLCNAAHGSEGGYGIGLL